MKKEWPTSEIDYRPPLAWTLLLKFLENRAIPGIEAVEDGRYLRTAVIGRYYGWVIVGPSGRENALRVEFSPPLTKVVAPLLERIKHMFDLDAQPQSIEAHLGADKRLAPIVKRQPGLRLPGAFDGFEMAMRAVLGQQISVRAARTIAGRFADAFGDPIDAPNPKLNRLSVKAERLARTSAADLSALGLPTSRAKALIALARAVAEDELKLEPGVDVQSAIERLKTLPGIGDWTAQYIAMRALRWSDAFIHTDLGVRKALNETSPKRVLEMAETWRPWRAYAVMHLWNSLG